MLKSFEDRSEASPRLRRVLGKSFERQGRVAVLDFRKGDLQFGSDQLCIVALLLI